MPWAWTKTMHPSISLSFPLNHKNVISDWLISDPTHCWTDQPSTIYLQVNSIASYLETPLECCVVLRKMGNAKKETSPWFRNELRLKTVWITHNPTSILWEKNCCVYTQTEAPWIIKVRNKQELVVEHSSGTILWQNSSHYKLIKFRGLRLQHTHKILTWEFKPETGSLRDTPLHNPLQCKEWSGFATLHSFRSSGLGTGLDFRWSGV